MDLGGIKEPCIRCGHGSPEANRPVKVGLDLEQIAIEGFLALTCLLGPSDEHIKSLQLLDTGKVVNLHKFKMAAVQSFNLQITFFLAAPRPYKCITNNIFWL